MAKHSKEQRNRAVDLYIKYERCAAAESDQAGVPPQARLRGRLDGRVHQHAQRLHGLVPEQEDQDEVRHEHHGSSRCARSCGMIGGDGINDESNKMSPAPSGWWVSE